MADYAGGRDLESFVKFLDSGGKTQEAEAEDTVCGIVCLGRVVAKVLVEAFSFGKIWGTFWEISCLGWIRWYWLWGFLVEFKVEVSSGFDWEVDNSFFNDYNK